MNCFNLVFERYACVFFSARWGGGNGNNGRLPSQKSSQTKNRNSQRQQQPQTLSPARPPRYVFFENIYVVNWNTERQGFWCFFVAKHNKNVAFLIQACFDVFSASVHTRRFHNYILLNFKDAPRIVMNAKYSWGQTFSVFRSCNHPIKSIS